MTTEEARADSLQLDNAREDLRKTMLESREALLRAAREIERYMDRIEAAENAGEMADNANWTIGMLAQVTGNLRISDLARCQASLTKLAR